MEFPQELLEVIPEEHRPACDRSELSVKFNIHPLGFQLLSADLANDKTVQVLIAGDHSEWGMIGRVGGENIVLVPGQDNPLPDEASAALSRAFHEAQIKDAETLIENMGKFRDWLKAQEAPEHLHDSLPELPVELQAAFPRPQVQANPMEKLLRMLGGGGGGMGGMLGG